MVRSMFAAVAGLRTHQTKMDVIGNNIANVNTYGFKSSRATFADVFYQTQKTASAASGNSGGTNPVQIGYGSTVGTVSVLNTRAGGAQTDRPMDVYISGDGYIPMMDGDGGIFYSRVGILGFDTDGNLVDINGNKVLGIPLNTETGNPMLMEDDGTIKMNNLQTIWIDPAELDKYTSISVGPNGEVTVVEEGDMAMVMNADFTSSARWLSDVIIDPDSKLSGKFNIQVSPSTIGAGGVPTPANVVATVGPPPTPEFDAANAEAYVVRIIGQDGSGKALTFTGVFYYDQLNGTITNGSNSLLTTEDTLTLSAEGTDEKMELRIDPSMATMTFPTNDGTPPHSKDDLVNLINTIYNDRNVGATPVGTAGADYVPSPVISGNSYSWSFLTTELRNAMERTDMATGYTGATYLQTVTPYLAEPVTFKLDNGSATNPGPRDFASARNEDGEPKKIAQLAITKFRNPDALLAEGNGYWRQSQNSGDPVSVIPGTKGTGTTDAGQVEMSNVDLSKEFTDMITTQRGFQANTRIITVTDEMLQELVNLKR